MGLHNEYINDRMELIHIDGRNENMLLLKFFMEVMDG